MGRGDRKHERVYSVAELFCGCGGFSHGFQRTGRFRVVFGNDVKGAALRTFALNHCDGQGLAPEVIRADIREVRVEQIQTALARRGVEELDCLLGGPPCQGFSQMRRSTEERDERIVRFRGYDKLYEDPRNSLVLRFLEIARALRPRYLVIENVPQMLRHGHNGILGGLQEAIGTLTREEMGYQTAMGVLNAADYGVPQLRNRAFILAARDGEARLPPPTHGSRTESAVLGLEAWVTVRDAIGDLPPPSPGPGDTLGGQSARLYGEVISRFAASMRSKDAFPYNHVTRGYSDRIMQIIREMRPGETWDHASERMREHYARMVEAERAPGEDEKSALRRLAKEGRANLAFYKRYYWSAYTRLAWDEPALTITANANFLGSGRFTHPEADRGITMREAARLQSFEDDFRFVTSESDDEDTATIGIGLDMIGEAVPPTLAEALGRWVAGALDSAETERAT